MSADIIVRSALPEEAGPLSALCRRSKAHWGYDAQFMVLSRQALTVKTDWIAAQQVVVAELDGISAGVAALAEDEGRHELALFFVEPTMMGRGVGARLYTAAIDLVRQKKYGISISCQIRMPLHFMPRWVQRLQGLHPPTRYPVDSFLFLRSKLPAKSDLTRQKLLLRLAWRADARAS